MNNLTFTDANDAFTYFYGRINRNGVEVGNGTRSLYNVGFTIEQPKLRSITAAYRNWNPTYANREWDWYLSENRSVEELKKFAPIWDKMHDGDNIVNSNYGYQWNRNNQLLTCMEELKRDPNSRRATITILDSKERHLHAKDTPCTFGIQFRIINKRLCMSVMMRSNDLWYGFCNDQYCFSQLQEMVARELKIDIGWYHHFATDMHLYERHYRENLKGHYGI